jgi:hypothetical protein
VEEVSTAAMHGDSMDKLVVAAGTVGVAGMWLIKWASCKGVNLELQETSYFW